MDVTIKNVRGYAIMRAISGMDYLNSLYNSLVEADDTLGQAYVHQELQAISDEIEAITINLAERFGEPTHV